MKIYQHLFFDLDRTLWDFEKSARETFTEVYLHFGLKQKGVPTEEEFVSAYCKNNNLLWSYYRKGEIKKEVLSVKRFEMTLNDFGIDDLALAAKIGDFYVTENPRKVNLFPYTHEILDYLQPKYKLHLITSRFVEVQQSKISNGKLGKYFQHVITSEMAGVKKPEKGIFLFAFDITDANAHNSLMIGDDLAVDIKGAREIDMDQLYVNHLNEEHNDEVTFEVNNLKEIKNIL